MEQKDYFGKDVGKLGFGLMRLPKKGLGFDIEQIKKMVDLFMEAGLTYYDTAYVYLGSEKAIRKALVDRYPRESYTLATKLNAWLLCRNEKAAKEQFDTSLKRTGAGYFDYYLLHALMTNNYAAYEKYHIWDYMKELRNEGKIRYYGFSYHSGPGLLDQLLTQHPDVDFVQLQINYADWENPKVASRANYEVARKHGKSVVVMEPVKGGALANPPKKVKAIFDAADSGMSYASWAIRFAASLDGILTVLSGMSNVAQMKDNLSYMKDFRPLDEKEREVIRRVQEVYNQIPTIPCTACHYCTGGCPKNIPIPEIFQAMNKQIADGRIHEAEADYAKAVKNAGRASDCIRCGQCENTCPQHLKVTDYLKQCAKGLE